MIVEILVNPVTDDIEKKRNKYFNYCNELEKSS